MLKILWTEHMKNEDVSKKKKKIKLKRMLMHPIRKRQLIFLGYIMRKRVGRIKHYQDMLYARGTETSCDLLYKFL